MGDTSPIHDPALINADDGTWYVDLSRSAVTDLSLLQGAPISSLMLSRTAVADLSPAR